MSRIALIGLLSLLFILAPIRSAKAASVGDAILTVGISTAAGAVLGLSTLPFYKEPSEHARNIFFGAAIGAVTGVLIMAYAGFQDSADSYDDAKLRKDDQYLLARTSAISQKPKPNSVISDAIVYSNLYEFRF